MYKSKFLESISIDQNVLADFPKEQTIEFDNLQSELLEDSRLAARQALFPDPQISEMEIEVLRQILSKLSSRVHIFMHVGIKNRQTAYVFI